MLTSRLIARAHLHIPTGSCKATSAKLFCAKAEMVGVAEVVMVKQQLPAIPIEEYGG